MVHEQEVNKGEIETVSVDPVQLNKNRLLITANLEMQAGEKSHRNTIQNQHRQ